MCIPETGELVSASALCNLRNAFGFLVGGEDESRALLRFLDTGCGGEEEG
jgi:hypothetical protein